MLGLIFANGQHDEGINYRGLADKADVVICADGGANAAYRHRILPHYIIGDMDSIEPEVLEYYRGKKTILKVYPVNKDFTDTQLAINLAETLHINELIMLGTLGKRMDHSISNLYSSIRAVERGVCIQHITAEMSVYIIKDQLHLKGKIDEIVSIFSLTAEAHGVTTAGLQYPLQEASLRLDEPYAVSNCLTATTASISVQTGILAVFHLHCK